MEIFLFPSYLSPLGKRITVFISAFNEIKHVRSEYEIIGTIFTSYVPSLVELRRVGATTRSKTTVTTNDGYRIEKTKQHLQRWQKATNQTVTMVFTLLLLVV